MAEAAAVACAKASAAAEMSSARRCSIPRCSGEAKTAPDAVERARSSSTPGVRVPKWASSLSLIIISSRDSLSSVEEGEEVVVAADDRKLSLPGVLPGVRRHSVAYQGSRLAAARSSLALKPPSVAATLKPPAVREAPLPEARTM